MKTADDLHKTGLKKTQGRTAILRLLTDVKKPLDINEIMKRLYKMKVTVNRTTVFRTINVLVKKGFIHRIELNEGKYRYESTLLPHHHHLVCTLCNRIIDIESDALHLQIKSLAKTVDRSYGFIIKDHKIEFFGACKSCRGI